MKRVRLTEPLHFEEACEELGSFDDSRIDYDASSLLYNRAIIYEEGDERYKHYDAMLYYEYYEKELEPIKPRAGMSVDDFGKIIVPPDLPPGTIYWTDGSTSVPLSFSEYLKDYESAIKASYARKSLLPYPEVYKKKGDPPF